MYYGYYNEHIHKIGASSVHFYNLEKHEYRQTYKRSTLQEKPVYIYIYMA